MNGKSYDNQAITAYLLGLLPAAEAERFDELNFTDDQFADELKAAEKDLIDGYVQGELTGATLEKFESQYLASPLRREKVEFADAFQIFAEKHIAAARAEIPAVGETKQKRTPARFFLDIFTIPRPVRQWSFALAALMLMLFGVWLFRENSRRRFEMSEAQANREQLWQRESELAEREKQLQGEITNQRSASSETERQLAQVREEREQRLKKQSQEQRLLAEQQKLDEQKRIAPTSPPVSPNRLNVATFVLAPSLRGGGNLPTVSIPTRTTAVAMRLELEADEYIAYRAVLRNQTSNRILWQSGKLKSKIGGENKSLNIGFPANLLKKQVYSIEVSGILPDGTAEIISNYSFRVVR